MAADVSRQMSNETKVDPECQSPLIPAPMSTSPMAESKGYAPVPTADEETEEEDEEARLQAIHFHQMTFLGRLTMIVQGQLFQGGAGLLIVANAVVIGCETDMPYLPYWGSVENLFVFLFTLELTLRLIVFGPSYFDTKSADFFWNMFDFFVVSLGLIDLMSPLLVGNDMARNGKKGNVPTLFRIIRLLRILRIFRIVRFLKQLYLIAFGLAEAMQAIFWVTMLMSFVLYVCSIVLVRFVADTSDDDPHRDFLVARFGSIGKSMLTLFELMSAPNLPQFQEQGHLLYAKPFLSAFLVAFVIFGSFGMIALPTGVISESMFEKNQLRMEEERAEREKRRKRLQTRCEETFDRLQRDIYDRACKEDVVKVIPKIEKIFDTNNVDYSKDDLYRAISLRDTENSGMISKSDFCESIIALAGGVRSISLQELDSSIRTIERRIVTLASSMEEAKVSADDTHSMVKDTLGGVTTKLADLLQAKEEERFDFERPIRELRMSSESRSDTLFTIVKDMGQRINEVEQAQREMRVAKASMLWSLQDLSQQVTASTKSQREALERMSTRLVVASADAKVPPAAHLPDACALDPALRVHQDTAEAPSDVPRCLPGGEATPGASPSTTLSHAAEVMDSSRASRGDSPALMGPLVQTPSGWSPASPARPSGAHFGGLPNAPPGFGGEPAAGGITSPTGRRSTSHAGIESNLASVVAAIRQCSPGIATQVVEETEALFSEVARHIRKAVEVETDSRLAEGNLQGVNDNACGRGDPS